MDLTKKNDHIVENYEREGKVHQDFEQLKCLYCIVYDCWIKCIQFRQSIKKTWIHELVLCKPNQKKTRQMDQLLLQRWKFAFKDDTSPPLYIMSWVRHGRITAPKKKEVCFFSTAVMWMMWKTHICTLVHIYFHLFIDPSKDSLT